MRRLGGRLRRPAVGAPVGLTSLLDVVTNLLVFLLVVGEPASGPDDVDLPASPSDLEPAPGEVSVDVTMGEIRVDGVAVVALATGAGGPELPAGTVVGRRIVPLYERLEGRVPVGVTDARILLRCDRGLPFAVVRDVLATAGDAGFGGFRFVVDAQPR